MQSLESSAGGRVPGCQKQYLLLDRHKKHHLPYLEPNSYSHQIKKLSSNSPNLRIASYYVTCVMQNGKKCLVQLWISFTYTQNILTNTLHLSHTNKTLSTHVLVTYVRKKAEPAAVPPTLVLKMTGNANVQKYQFAHIGFCNRAMHMLIDICENTFTTVAGSHVCDIPWGCFITNQTDTQKNYLLNLDCRCKLV